MANGYYSSGVVENGFSTEAVGGGLSQIARVGIYLTDLSRFSEVNAVMAEFFSAPYPARSTIEVSALPRGAQVEVDAVMVLD